MNKRLMYKMKSKVSLLSQRFKISVHCHLLVRRRNDRGKTMRDPLYYLLRVTNKCYLSFKIILAVGLFQVGQTGKAEK